MELNFATWQAAWATELACIAVELEKAMASASCCCKVLDSITDAETLDLEEDE